MNAYAAACTGETLFLIPLIDMVNHSSQPEKRNASLQLQQAGKPGLQAASFCLKAGQACVHEGALLLSALRLRF